ncbi:MAG TPA: protein-tyrosine phosphatase family protein [Vicinamibacterales bacterium]|nr:protein-tyrosine phosphatase family protein [Vicinamibacterales bacterium]
MTPTGPIPDSYWLIDGMVLAGPYPGADDDQDARARVSSLLDAGIRTFIDLTEASEPIAKYDGLVQSLATERGIEAKHLRHAVRDHGVPVEREQMQRILATMREEMEAGRPLYVHCWGGIGRTGTVIGCWLVEEGLDGPAAIDRIAELRARSSASRTPSPETDGQCRYICEWLDGSSS